MRLQMKQKRANKETHGTAGEIVFARSPSTWCGLKSLQLHYLVYGCLRCGNFASAVEHGGDDDAHTVDRRLLLRHAKAD
jgi:hypothetical protein